MVRKIVSTKNTSHKQSNARYSYIGLLKFFAAVGIVFLHSGKGDSHWGCLWILVEFFFMLTGYFTYKHFQKDSKSIARDTLEQKSNKSIKYSISKFASFLPYMLIGVVAFYIAISLYELRHGIGAALSSLKTMPFDLLFLNSQLPRGNWAIWFISAMAIMFPIFCILCQTKRQKTLCAVMLPFIITYFLRIYDDKIYGVYAYCRAFFGMSAGIYMSHMVDYIKTIKLSKSKTILLNIIELVATIVAIICMYPGSKSIRVEFCKLFAILSIFVMLTLILSGKTLTSKIHNRLFDFLERISMVIYLTHVAVLWFTEIVLTSLNAMQYMRIACVTFSVLIAICTYVIVESITRIIRTRHAAEE